MRTDKFSRKGTGFNVNKDYIINGSNYIIMSEGRYEAEMSDIGQRIMCLLARQYLSIRKESYIFPAIDYDEMGLWVIYNAERQVRELGLNPMCLDATLTVAFEHEDRVYIYMYGNGVVIMKHESGSIHITETSFTKGEPYVLLYKIMPDVADYYHKLKQDLIIKTHYQNPVENTYAYDYQSKYILDTETFPVILVGTRGFMSFTSDGGTDINPVALAESFTNYKNSDGNFLHIAADKVIKTFFMNQIDNKEDCSIGAFINEVKYDASMRSK